MLTFRPATPLDVADLIVASRLGVTQPAYSTLLRQLGSGPSWTAIGAPAVAEGVAGGPVAIAGVWRDGDCPSVVWFLVSPSIGRDLLQIVRFGRHLLETERARRPEGLVVGVMPGNDKGERLAAALGFTATGMIVPGGARIWEYATHGQDGVGTVRRRLAPA